MAATKTTRKNPLPGYIMAIAGFTACAVTPFILPVGLHTRENYNTLSTIAGVLFWAGLLVGILGCQVASGAVRSDPVYKKGKSHMRSCLTTFGSSLPALIDLVVFIIGLVITLTGYVVHLPGALSKLALFLTIWTFLMHFVLDGRPWRYMVHRMSKGLKKQETALEADESGTLKDSEDSEDIQGNTRSDVDKTYEGRLEL